MSALQCPGCDSRLQPFFASTASGAELELDRCPFCGGVFVELRRLAELLGDQVSAPSPLPGHTARRCGRCRLSMTPTTLRGIPVEHCRSCSAVYLDEGELHEFAGRDVGLRSGGLRKITVACARCERRVAASEAVDDEQGAGLLCRSCGFKPKSKDLAEMPKGLTHREPEDFLESAYPEDAVEAIDELVWVATLFD